MDQPMHRFKCKKLADAAGIANAKRRRPIAAVSEAGSSDSFIVEANQSCGTHEHNNVTGWSSNQWLGAENHLRGVCFFGCRGPLVSGGA
ncbi:unnamed protein product [Protopolystoma xenopodis]|uniref:Uncharacterized protein n=1 Tax=Protopolystoma xenopodis TaxID=117903 RepID=A0A448XM03_9PLAT|nr:unnamed protein product [Protopolystoma xenopodis]